MSEYDQFAQAFSQTRPHPWNEFKLFIPFIHPQNRILDLGCGNGRMRAFLSSHKHALGNYFGFDISENFLSIAREEYPHDHFFRGDMNTPLPFGNDTFHSIVAIASFHHLLSRKAQIQCLQECHRTLRKDGIIFFTTWNLPKKHFWPNILRGRFKNWIIPFGVEKHPRTYRRTSQSELRSLCARTGFQVLHLECFQNRNFILIAQKKNS